jgi:predicted enzyme related to lactoylglutathione lyase
MPATLRHFAINADDVQRAKRFYEGVFGWDFTPWGLGALQGRRELKPGEKMLGAEITMGVDDLKATMAAIEAGGGKVLMGPWRLEGVGELIFFEDTEGNLLGAMQYEPGYWD